MSGVMREMRVFVRTFVTMVNAAYISKSSDVLPPYDFFKNKELPTQRSRPSAMMAILSPRRSASSMKWVVKIIHLS